MKILNKYVISIVLISVVLFLLGFSFYGLHKWFIVGEIQLKLEESPVWESPKNKIQSLLSKKLRPFIGRKLWQVSLEDLMQVLVSEPRVGEVKILRLFPNRFFVQIKPRRPLLVFLNPSSEKIHPLSMSGQILAPLSFNQIPDLPILRGAVFLTQSKIREQAIRFLSIMPEQGAFSRQEISEIKYSHQEKKSDFHFIQKWKAYKSRL